MTDNRDFGRAEGAGGEGPAGGGGGGAQGRGARGGFEDSGNSGEQRIQYVQVAPTPGVVNADDVAPIVVPPVTPPVVKVPEPVVKAQDLPKDVPPVVKPPEVVAKPSATTMAPSPTGPGTPASGVGQDGGSGSGGKGGTGAGSGTGGGVGSGDGTGRGSGVGAGTGGGDAENYPPTPSQVFLPPLPAPQKVRGFKLTAWFDVDTTGKATLLRFTPTPDAGYNRKLRETLLAMKFRPAVRPDGVPVRDTIDVHFNF